MHFGILKRLDQKQKFKMKVFLPPSQACMAARLVTLLITQQLQFNMHNMCTVCSGIHGMFIQTGRDWG